MRNIGRLIFTSNEDTAYEKDYIFYKYISKKAPTFREEMNCG